MSCSMESVSNYHINFDFRTAYEVEERGGLMRKNGIVAVLCGLFLFIHPGQGCAEDSCLTSYYQKSLHFSGQGMRSCYEGQNGFMTLTKIPFSQAGCSQCHARSCDQCHGIEAKKGKMGFSVKESRKEATCLKCHEEEKLVMEFNQESGNKDVHTAAKMSCLSCHKDEDIHGDGVAREKLRDAEAITPTCEGCHVGEKTKGPRFDPDIKPHLRHKKCTELDCTACHVRSSVTCYNCHFSEFMKTKNRKGNFIPTTDLLMLVNYQGKVTAATAVVLVDGKKTFVSYTPYFTHNVMKKGRDCTECHGNAGMQLVSGGKKIPVATFENGKVKFWSGVVPIADNILQWQFFDKRKGNWVPLNTQKPDIERFTNCAGPLTEKQLKMLRIRFGGGSSTSESKDK